MIYQKVQSSHRLLPQHVEVLDSQSRHHLNFSKHGKPRFSVAFAGGCGDRNNCDSGSIQLSENNHILCVTLEPDMQDCKWPDMQETTMNNECRRNTCTPISGFPTSTIPISKTPIFSTPARVFVLHRMHISGTVVSTIQYRRARAYFSFHMFTIFI